MDVDPVLRLFGAKRDVARERFARYIAMGAGEGYREDLCSAEGGVLGSEEFVDAAIHRIGETGRPYRPTDGRLGNVSGKFNPEALIAAVEAVCGVPVESFRGPARSARATAAKEALIVAGRRLGATVNELSQITGLDTSNISRRYAAALSRQRVQHELYDPTERIIEAYKQLAAPNSANTQA